MDTILMLAADDPAPTIVQNLQMAGSALWAIVQSHGIGVGAGALAWHGFLKKSGRIKAKSTR